MRPFRIFLSRCAALLRRRATERDMSAEIAAHVDALTERHIAAGLSRADARNAALREFGGVEQIKERCRDEMRFRWLDETLRDARYACRYFRRSPGFATVAVVSLAVAIGANTSIFTLLNAALFKPAPTAHPEQLVLLSWSAPKWPAPFSQTGADARFSFSYPAFERLQQANTGLRDLFAFVPAGFGARNVTVDVDGTATLATALMVTGNYFPGLTVEMIAGRGITEADESRGRAPVAVISDAFWAAHFNRAPAVIGRTVVVNNVPCTIVGVAPPHFYGQAASQSLTKPDLWLPFSDTQTLRPWGVPPVGSASIYTAHDWICLNLMGRVPAGMPVAVVQDRLNAAFQRFVAETWPGVKPNQLPRLKLVPSGYGLPGMPDEVGRDASILMAGVALLLVVACANLATLLLARADARQREIAVRAALGASRPRLVRQLLTESVLLALAGGALGLLLATWANALLATLVAPNPADLPLDITVDGRAFGFAAIVSLATGVLFGLLPSLRATRSLALAASQTRGATGLDRRSQWLGGALVSVQLALSLLLVVCAGLFVRTLRNMQNRDLGFESRGLFVFGLDPTRTGWSGLPLLHLYQEIRDDLAALPGVTGVTLYDNLPFTGSNNTSFFIDGVDLHDARPTVRWDSVGPGFCRTMGIRLTAGRDLLARDTAGAPKVGLVNEAFVRAYLHGGDAIGQRFIGPAGDDRFEIVGVVHDAELTSLHAAPMPKAYVPYAQLPLFRLNAMYFEVRTSGAPVSALPEIRRTLQRLAPSVPLINPVPQDELTHGAMFVERMFARLAAIFGLAALLVSSIGVYGTTAYHVTRRTNEIGIRMALGASARSAVTLVLRQSALVIGFGIAAGAMATLGVTVGLRRVLYGVGASDPATLVCAALIMTTVGFVAAWLPARRAAAVDPVTALRAE